MCPAPPPAPSPSVAVNWLAKHIPVPVDVAGAGAPVVAAAEVAAAGAAEDVLADTVVVAAVEVVADPPEVVLGVHPASDAAIATKVSIAASPGRAPDPGPMAGRYSRAGSREGPNLRHRAGFEKLCIQALTSVLPMDLTVARCFVTVTDPDKALAFYRDVLGLELVMDVPKGDFRWIAVGSKSQPGVDVLPLDLPTWLGDLLVGRGKRLRVAMSYWGFLAAGGTHGSADYRYLVRAAAALEALHLHLIEAADYDVFTKRQRVPGWEKLLVAL
jgi:catechol 2,3-dioxygenase-like lactoylglutathione lyase family enzyme